MSLALNPVEVEVLDMSPRGLAGGMAANFARVQILVTFYEGDPRLWMDAIERQEMPSDDGDQHFLESMQQRMSNDPTLLDDLRRIVGEFAARFGSAT